MGNVARGVLVLVAIVAGALALTFLGPTAVDTSVYKSDKAVALSTARLNEGRTEGAPQQQVVNGWAARDLAEIQIDQNNAVLDQQAKTNQLLFIGIVVVGLAAGLLSLGQAQRRSNDAVKAGVVSDVSGNPDLARSNPGSGSTPDSAGSILEPVGGHPNPSPLTPSTSDSPGED